MRLMQTTYLAGGCFWCTEAVFQSLNGVISVIPGYTGGTTANPTYHQVVEGNTGHAEAIKIEFDPTVISLDVILAVFFATHDPTSLNRQGADVGEQYRSAIFYTSTEQKQQAAAFIAQLEVEGTFGKPIVTALEQFTSFYEAEEYHKNYYLNNSDAPYCRITIDPKIAKLKQKFAAYIKRETI